MPAGRPRVVRPRARLRLQRGRRAVKARADPGGHIRHMARQAIRYAVRVAPQRLQHAGQRGQHGQQHRHPPAQSARVAQRVGALRVVRELRDELVQREDVGGQPVAAAVARGVGVGVGRQHVGGPECRVRQPGGRARAQRGRYLGREDDGTHHAGAEDADDDFLDARNGDIEDLRRLAHRGQRHDWQRIRGQQEDIAARRALQQREIEQAPRPQGDRGHQQHRRVDQQRHRDHRGSGAQHRARHAIRGLGAGGAGQRVRNKIDGCHGPVRAGQTQRERDIERQHRGGKRLQ